ncbi:hypothetical protein DFH06DRAFT_1353504 [Mycena polygramma]|nr:hypothetical protein DFH06DRAFT_1353504 [Mycena polygramma]
MTHFSQSQAAPTAPHPPVAASWVPGFNPPAPPAGMTPTGRAGIQRTGPWIAGELYGVVPAGPLATIPDIGEKWYAITKGRFVGVTNSTAVADGAVSRVSHALRSIFDTQQEAVDAFNLALAANLGLIQVI